MDNAVPAARRLTDAHLRSISIGLSALGLLVALYLVYIKFNPASSMCVGVGDCEAVNNSIYSVVNGIPVAALGALAYAALLGIFLLETRSALLGEWGPLAAFGLALTGALYSAYLTYIELFVIFKICPYCVTSAVLITLILGLAVVRLKRYM